jgi:hypothetical protein
MRPDARSSFRPDLPNTNPECFVEARFINELDKSGFFDEMRRPVAMAPN